MFQTLAMEVRPFPSVNAAPAPQPAAVPATAVASSAPEQPPPPAVSTNTPTAAASAGPGSPHEVSQSEDATNGNSSARRPGNLWTAEDREDMFNRRENGEGWETICADYPNRSRHAMQQQYSMMKKQKALADGTWASNRRGRKRRNPAPERAPAAAKRSEPYTDPDEQMTEADDFEEPNSDDTEVYDDSGGKMSNGRPNPLMRSSTEPVKAGRQRNAHSASAGITPTNGNRAASQQPDPDASYTTGRQSKKRRLSGDQASNVQVSTPSETAEYQPSNVMLDYDELFAILRKGVEHARTQRRALEQERAQRTASYAASLQRANRRANDAHERFSWATYEHGENVKKIRGEAALSLKDKAREHAEAIEKMAAQREDDRRAHYKVVAGQAAAIDELRKENDMLKMNPVDREKAMMEQIDQLKADKTALEDAKREWEATAKTEPQPSTVQSAEQAGSSNMDSKLDSLALLESSVYGTSKHFASDFDRIAAVVAKFHDEVEDLGHKRTVQYLVDIVALKDAAVSKMAQLTSAVKDLHQAFTKLMPERTDGHPSTTTADQGMPQVSKPKASNGSSSPPSTLNLVPTISESPAPPNISIEEATPIATTSSPLPEVSTSQSAAVRPSSEAASSPSRQGPDAALPSIQEESISVAPVGKPAPSQTPDVEMKDESAKETPQPHVVAPHATTVEAPTGEIPVLSAAGTTAAPAVSKDNGGSSGATPSIEVTQEGTHSSGDVMEQ